jgi:hypothetical protein
MQKISLAAAALCFTVSAVAVPFAVQAEPKLLTAAQLDSVSAGNALSKQGVPVINIYLEGVNVGLGNINIAAQVALATASATAYCIVCSGDTIATAFATASNFNHPARQIKQQ